MKRSLVTAAIALAAVVAMAGTASAQVNFVGTATGCFYVGGTVCTSPSALATMNATSGPGTITYVGSSFNATSNAMDGILSLPNLGTLAVLNANGSNFTGISPNFNHFALYLNFTQPSIQGGTFTSLLRGNISLVGDGNIRISFDPSTQDQMYTFSDGTVLRNFEVGSPVSLSTDVPVATLYGTGDVDTTVPEPASLVLMGTALVGLIPVIRRRKK